MEPFSLNGVNGSVTLDANGVTIANRIFGKTRTIGWSDLAGAAIKKGTFFARPKFYVLSNRELAFVKSDFTLLNERAASQMDEWAIFFATGEEAQWQALLRAVNHAAATYKQALKLGERVLVQMNDGQKYVANLVAIEPRQMLVLFPNGSQSWVARDLVQRA